MEVGTLEMMTDTVLVRILVTDCIGKNQTQKALMNCLELFKNVTDSFRTKESGISGLQRLTEFNSIYVSSVMVQTQG